MTVARRVVQAEHVVEHVLRIARDRRGTDDAEQQLEIVHAVAAVLLQQAEAAVEPAGIGPIVRIGHGAREIARREDRLRQRHELDLPARRRLGIGFIGGGECRQQLAERIDTAVEPAAARERRTEQAQQQTLRVVAVTAGRQHIVLLDHRGRELGAGPRGRSRQRERDHHGREGSAASVCEGLHP